MLIQDVVKKHSKSPCYIDAVNIITIEFILYVCIAFSHCNKLVEINNIVNNATKIILYKIIFVVIEAIKINCVLTEAVKINHILTEAVKINHILTEAVKINCVLTEAIKINHILT